MFPLLQGITATVVAAAALLTWVAIGSCCIRRVSAASALFFPGSVLVGASLTSAVLAVASRAGAVREGTLAVAITGVLILILRRHVVIDQVRQAARTIRMSCRQWPLAKWFLPSLAVIAWVYAIAPPRDGDVMRYHLAHIRQIISDGAWTPIADITYALPFAWSLNYLPFELLHLPQAAHLANLGLGLVVVATLLRLMPASSAPGMKMAVVLLVFAHPFVVRIFTSAFADGYAVLATTVILAGLLSLHHADAPATGLLGFATWVGMGSRYQLVAVGIAGTGLFAFHAMRSRQRRSMVAFAGGSALAMFLASPFYFANFLDFGNPVWPLMITRDAAVASYANEVAYSFISGFASSPGPMVRVDNAIQLFTTTDLAPLPLLLLLVVVVTFWKGDRGHRYVASFVAIFVALWELISPRLYPTHILPLLTAVPILLAGIIESYGGELVPKRLVRNALVVAVVFFTSISAFFAVDHARYSLTRDVSEFHRYTWYYRTYDWVNRNTSPSSRFLVVVLSGHTYYLDRQYRRADPWLSGEVDWRRIASTAALDSMMIRERYEYLIYDDRNWSQFPGGDAMGAIVRSAMAYGTLVPVHHSRDPLYTSRVRRTSSRASVYVLRRNSSNHRSRVTLPARGR